MGLRGGESELLLAFWVGFCRSILALIQRLLILGVASLRVISSTVLASNLGEVKGISLYSALGFTLGRDTVFFSLAASLKMLERYRSFWCIIPDGGWIGGGVGVLLIILTRSWAAPISGSVSDGCGIGVLLGSHSTVPIMC